MSKGKEMTSIISSRRISYRNKRGKGFALDWLEGHEYLLDKFLYQNYISEKDREMIQNFAFENPIQFRQIIQDNFKKNEQKIQEILGFLTEDNSKIISIFGGRGSGKTALGFKWLEIFKKNYPKAKIFYVGKKSSALPKWVKFEERLIDTPENSINLSDESAIQYSARSHSDDKNKELGKQLAIARHNNKTVMFMSQHALMIDVNIIRLSDIILWKRQTTYNVRLERENSKAEQFWSKIRTYLIPSTKNETLFEYPLKKRFIKFSTPLPDCWTEELSKSWADWKGDPKKEKSKGGKRKTRIIHV